MGNGDQLVSLEVSASDLLAARKFAFSTALHSPRHEDHHEPYKTADEIFHYIMTGEHPS